MPERLVTVSDYANIGVCLLFYDTFHTRNYSLHSEIDPDPKYGYKIYSFAQLIAWKPDRAQLWRLKRPTTFSLHNNARFINKHIIAIERAIHYQHGAIKPTREKW